MKNSDRSRRRMRVLGVIAAFAIMLTAMILLMSGINSAQVAF